MSAGAKRNSPFESKYASGKTFRMVTAYATAFHKASTMGRMTGFQNFRYSGSARRKSPTRFRTDSPTSAQGCCLKISLISEDLRGLQRRTGPYGLPILLENRMRAVEILRECGTGGDSDAIGLSCQHQTELPLEFAPHIALDLLTDADHVEMSERAVVDFREILYEIGKTFLGIIVKNGHELTLVRNAAGGTQRQVLGKSVLPLPEKIRRRGKQAFDRNRIERASERIDPLFDGRRSHAVIVGGNSGVDGSRQTVTTRSFRTLSKPFFRMTEIHVEIRRLGRDLGVVAIGMGDSTVESFARILNVRVFRFDKDAPVRTHEADTSFGICGAGSRRNVHFNLEKAEALVADLDGSVIMLIDVDDGISSFHVDGTPFSVFLYADETVFRIGIEHVLEFGFDELVVLEIHVPLQKPVRTFFLYAVNAVDVRFENENFFRLQMREFLIQGSPGFFELEGIFDDPILRAKFAETVERFGRIVRIDLMADTSGMSFSIQCLSGTVEYVPCFFPARGKIRQLRRGDAVVSEVVDERVKPPLLVTADPEGLVLIAQPAFRIPYAVGNENPDFASVRHFPYSDRPALMRLGNEVERVVGKFEFPACLIFVHHEVLSALRNDLPVVGKIPNHIELRLDKVPPLPIDEPVLPLQRFADHGAVLGKLGNVAEFRRFARGVKKEGSVRTDVIEFSGRILVRGESIIESEGFSRRCWQAVTKFRDSRLNLVHGLLPLGHGLSSGIQNGLGTLRGDFGDFLDAVSDGFDPSGKTEDRSLVSRYARSQRPDSLGEFGILRSGRRVRRSEFSKLGFDPAEGHLGIGKFRLHDFRMEFSKRLAHGNDLVIEKIVEPPYLAEFVADMGDVVGEAFRRNGSQEFIADFDCLAIRGFARVHGIIDPVRSEFLNGFLRQVSSVFDQCRRVFSETAGAGKHFW